MLTQRMTALTVARDCRGTVGSAGLMKVSQPGMLEVGDESGELSGVSIVNWRQIIKGSPYPVKRVQGLAEIELSDDYFVSFDESHPHFYLQLDSERLRINEQLLYFHGRGGAI